MVNDNVLRQPSVKDLEGIYVYTSTNPIFYKGSDIADYNIEDNRNISILFTTGCKRKFYNVGFMLTWKNKEEL